MSLRAGATGLLAVLVLAACGAAGSPVTVGQGRLAVGAPAINFSATTLDGRMVSLQTLRGHPILLNFWATWCAECRAEMPAIQAALDRHESSGLTVVAINFRESDVAAQRDFLRRAGARFPSVLDPDGKVADAYGVAIGLPVSVFISRTGTVSYIQVGPMTPDFIEERIAVILGPSAR